MYDMHNDIIHRHESEFLKDDILGYSWHAIKCWKSSLEAGSEGNARCLETRQRGSRTLTDMISDHKFPTL